MNTNCYSCSTQNGPNKLQSILNMELIMLANPYNSIVFVEKSCAINGLLIYNRFELIFGVFEQKS